jgi:putative FmdB family regulatory protein
MPCYDMLCSKCGVFEIVKGMNDPCPKRCPTCRGKVDRVFNTRVAFIPPVDSSWHLENNGAGRYIGQLGAIDDPNAYCRSRNLIPERAKRAGFQRIEKC